MKTLTPFERRIRTVQENLIARLRTAIRRWLGIPQDLMNVTTAILAHQNLFESQIQRLKREDAAILHRVDTLHALNKSRLDKLEEDIRPLCEHHQRFYGRSTTRK